MVFKSTKDNGGIPDPNINRQGSIPKKERNKYSVKEIREKELMFLLRKFKPNLHKAVKVAVDMLDKEDTSDQNKLKASALILKTYQELIKDVYTHEDDNEEGKGIEESGAVFSLKMIKDDSEEDSKE